MGFAQFMASTAGRGLRVVAGVALIIIGLTMGGTGGWILAIVGLLPLATGALDICLLGRLFGQPISGAEVRNR